MKFFSGMLAVFNNIVMLLILVLPIVSASDNISLLPDDPRGIVGESLQMWCSISSTSGVKSSDLELHLKSMAGKRNFTVDSHFIEIVNETTVEMNYLDLPMMLNNAVVTCRLKSSKVNQTEATKKELLDEQILQVGYRPFKPNIAKDYKVYNWEHLIFNWSINETDPVYLTKYEAWYKSGNAPNFIRCEKAKQRNTCKIAKVLNLVHPHGYLHFKVNGSNAGGQITSNIEKSNLYHRIQPGKVKNVTVNSSVSNGVLAEFYSPNDDYRLKYQISVACGNTAWPVILIENSTAHNSKGPIRWKIEHVLPPFTKCHLSVSCLPFSNYRYWSDWSENVSFTSPDGLPLVGPQLCCFEIEPKDLKQRKIKVYYKNLTAREARGEIVSYYVLLNILTSGSQMNFTGVKEKIVGANELFFLLDVNSETSYTLSVSPQTRAGRNPAAVSLMPVLIRDEILPLPQNVTAIWYGSGIVTVSWLPLEEKSVSYTVVWCKGYSQCEKRFDWKITSDSSYNIQLPSDETHLSYRFGIVVSRVGGGSSGIKWLDCIYNISAGASAPSVYLFNKTSSAVSLHFSEPKCGGGNNGYIYEYQVYFMKDEENVSIIETLHRLKSAKWKILIDHLEPNSNYSFNVVALTYNGPSERMVMNETTARSEKLTKVQQGFMVVGAVLAVVFIPFGIYFCYRYNKNQFLKFMKWLNMDITIPKQQTLDNREPADGGHLSSSYTSLTKNQVPLLLSYNTQHSEQMKNSSHIKDEKQGVLTAARGIFPVVQDARPVTEGDSVHLLLTVKNLSGPNEELTVISEDSGNSIASNPKLDQSRIILVNRSTSSARLPSSSASEKSISDQPACKKYIPKDTKSVVSQNLQSNVLLIQQPEHFLSSNNHEVSSSSMPSAQAVKHNSSSLAHEDRISSTIDHSPGNATGCVSDDTTFCGIDHDTDSAEQPRPMNRRLLASTTETQNEQQMTGDAFIPQNTMHTLDAGTLGSAATSLSYHHLDESDEVEDYSNVRIADPSGHIESSAEIFEDGYSLARPPAAGDEFTEEESDNDYSNATLSADVHDQLVTTEAHPVLQSLMDNGSHDESAEEEEEDNDNNYSDNYSRASIFRRRH